MSFFTGRRQNDTDPEIDLKQSSAIGFDTVLSASTILDGTLKSEGNIRLDGHFTGKLNITGNVLVGETAEINADIDARNISIAGIVRGNVTGNKVQLLKTGRIWGNIHSNSLTTEDGAFIDGKIIMNADLLDKKTEESEDELPSDVDIMDDETVISIDDKDLSATSPHIPDEIDETDTLD